MADTVIQRTDFRHLERLRVRWAEVDLQKIVFNAHYLMYFDTAVAGYWRAMRLPYHETMEIVQGDFFARKATVEYLASARYEDLIDVGVRCARIGNSSMALACAVFRGSQLLVHGELLYVFADPKTQTSRPIPPPLRAWFDAFEAGQPMLDVRCEADAGNADAMRAVAVSRMGTPLGSVSGVRQGKTVTIGGPDVLPGLRGSGIGRALVDTLAAAAKQRGATEALLQPPIDDAELPGVEPRRVL
jgi:YbgC/YbaW family acyl-CoA thioester hydrolase